MVTCCHTPCSQPVRLYQGEPLSRDMIKFQQGGLVGLSHSRQVPRGNTSCMFKLQQGRDMIPVSVPGLLQMRGAIFRTWNFVRSKHIKG